MAAMTSSAHIQPGEPLPLDPTRDQHIEVTDGIVYVMFDEHDAVLTPGDEITIRAGSARRAWNAGDGVARVIRTISARLSAFPAALAA